MSNNATSIKHHFVPQFYFRAWSNPETKLFWLYQRNTVGAIEIRERPAKSVGFVPHLYSWLPTGLDFDQAAPDQLEQDFFGPLDDAAAIVHQKLITSGFSALAAEDRSVWAWFLKSLIERSPKRIREVEQSADLSGTWADDFARLWPGRHPDAGAQAFFSRLDRAAMIRNTLLGEMVRQICDRPFIEGLQRMEWLTVDLPPGEDHFLTGDTPLIFNGGVRESPIFALSIAISPTKLFVVHQKDEAFDREWLGLLTYMHSVNIVLKAEKYVVSSRPLTDSRFIKYAKVVEEAL